MAAIINPDIYLPYASAAVTLLAFFASQLYRVIYLRTEVLIRVKEFLWTVDWLSFGNTQNNH